MSRTRKWLAALVAVACPLAATAQDDVVRLLTEQGRFWQARGDHERAIETWEKLLRADPRQPDALYGMAMAALAAGRPLEAQQHLVRLRTAAPQSPYVGRLEQELALHRPGARGKLDAARAAARQGESEQALALYEDVLAGKPPQGELALEYYQTLAAHEDGWIGARAGLQRLVLERPDDLQARLALAQVLSYREDTRTEAIRHLSELAREPAVAESAEASWRQALTWLGEAPAQRHIPLLQAYLQAHPDDSQVSRQLQNAHRAIEAARPVIVPPDPLVLRARAAFDALEAGRLDEAEAEFTHILGVRPRQADALGGMGVLRLRQQRFAEARELLQRASQRGPAQRWREALASAAYWADMQAATLARNRGDLPEARRLLADALGRNPGEPSGHNALAAVQVELGELDAAEQTYRRLLERQPANVDAVQGLVGLLAQGGRAREALQLAARLAPAQQDRIEALGRLRAALALERARAARAQGNLDAAATALEEAVLSDPGNAWVRLDLAHVYVELGATRYAQGLIDTLLASNPDMPDALYLRALIAARAQDWAGVLASAARIPPQLRTSEMSALHRRAWVHSQAAHAGELARQGQPEAALAALEGVTPEAGDDAELLGVLAVAHADAGDPGRALALMRESMRHSVSLPPALQLRYAGLLLATGQDLELAGILRQLDNAELDARQLDTYRQIRHAHTVRQADALRARGQFADAYALLAPTLAARPDDARALAALARLHAEAGDPRQALPLYERALRLEPDHVETLAGAASAAAASGDLRGAQSRIGRALAAAPRNPDVLAAAAHVQRAQGNEREAEALLRQADALRAAATLPVPMSVADTAGVAAAQPAVPAAPPNPFQNRNTGPEKLRLPSAQPLPFGPAEPWGGRPGAPRPSI